MHLSKRTGEQWAKATHDKAGRLQKEACVVPLGEIVSSTVLCGSACVCVCVCVCVEYQDVRHCGECNTVQPRRADLRGASCRGECACVCVCVCVCAWRCCPCTRRMRPRSARGGWAPTKRNCEAEGVRLCVRVRVCVCVQVDSEIQLPSGFICKPFPTTHSIPSQGYLLYSLRKKLRADLQVRNSTGQRGCTTRACIPAISVARVSLCS